MITRIYRKETNLLGYKKFVLIYEGDDIGKYLNKGDYFFPSGTGFTHKVLYKTMSDQHICGGGDPCTNCPGWVIDVIVKKL